MSVSSVGSCCCGCRACKQVCNIGAISVVKDEYGFEKIYVDAKLCVECEKCERVCPAINTGKGENKLLLCGVAYSLDKDIKSYGSSGGLFGTIANHIVSHGGVVFGAAFDKRMHLKTIAAKKLEELKPLYKSKYLLCNTDGSFKEIKRCLEEDFLVLYCSSPCQVQALKLYLKNDYTNLITVDFVCHGVGSQHWFDASINGFNKEKRSKIVDFTFRQKVNNAASSHYYSVEYDKNGTVVKKSDLYFSFPYYNAYCKQLVCRDSCYLCQYARKSRVSDITIGDFHNVEKYCEGIDRFSGVSMFLCNTAKGEFFLNNINSELKIIPLNPEILYSNNRFSADYTEIPEKVIKYRYAMASKNEKIINKYLYPITDTPKYIYYKTPKLLRKFIIKMIGKIK